MLIDLGGPGGDYRRFGEPDLAKVTLVGDALKWLGKTVGGHISSAYVLHVELTKFDVFFGVVIRNIYVLSTLVVTFRV